MALDVIRLISNMSNMILSVLSNATWLRTDNALGGEKLLYIHKIKECKKKKSECVYVELGRVVVGTNTRKK